MAQLSPSSSAGRPMLGEPRLRSLPTLASSATRIENAPTPICGEPIPA